MAVNDNAEHVGGLTILIRKCFGNYGQDIPKVTLITHQLKNNFIKKGLCMFLLHAKLFKPASIIPDFDSFRRTCNTVLVILWHSFPLIILFRDIII